MKKRKKVVVRTFKPSLKEWRKQQRAEWQARYHSSSVRAYSGGLPSLGKRR
jgi:hypothetical protein